MKISQTDKLLEYLIERCNHWTPSQQVADFLNVSTRQIRKYISIINENASETLIFSSNSGYKLDIDRYSKEKETEAINKIETPITRQNYIIQKLICCDDGYDLFDFSDELYVSNATIENDLKSIRKEIKDYKLSLKKDKNNIRLIGNEKLKRNLMSHLISSDSYDSFVLKDEVRLLTFHYHFWDFRKNINDIFAENDIFANDYTLNNTAIHLIITIDRIRNHCELQEFVNLDKFKVTQQYKVSKCIAEFIEDSYNVKINDSELYNLILIISNNTTIMDYSFINSENISEYIEQKYIDIAHQVIHKVEKCYYLDSFDEDFIAKFTIHVKNLFNRMQNNYYAKNPLTAKIKATYPLIYDIAVFIAQDFKTDYDVTLNEDEITFIAFHIGSYFENNVQSKSKVSCIFIYADYYSIHKNLLDKITKKFEDKISMKCAVSINNFNPSMIHADLIISTVETQFSTPSIIINPFLTEKDIHALQERITYILSSKRSTALKAYLLNFFDKNLFYKDAKFKNKEEAIFKLSQDVVNLGYSDEGLYDEILARENMSSTAFYDVAVPHSLSKDAKHSFIAIAISQDVINWDSHQVHIIALIGVNKDSRKVFSEVFDELIDILSEPPNIKELVISKDFDDFILRIMKMMDKE